MCLLYVGLTRAREQTHILANINAISDFALELSENPKKVKVFEIEKDAIKCNACSDGLLVKKQFDDETVFICSNYPVCKNRGLTCFECKKDLVVIHNKIEKAFLSEKKTKTAVCLNKECNYTHEPCDLCEDGIMELIKGSYGEFLGCHNFRRTQCPGKKEI